MFHLGLPQEVTTPPSKDYSMNENPCPYNQSMGLKGIWEPLHIQGIDMNYGTIEVFLDAISRKDLQEIAPKMASQEDMKVDAHFM